MHLFTAKQKLTKADLENDANGYSQKVPTNWPLSLYFLSNLSLAISAFLRVHPWRPTTFCSTQFFTFYFFTSLIGGFKGGREELGGIKGDIDGFEGFKGDKEGLRGILRILSIKMDRGIYRDEEDLLLNFKEK